VDVAGAVTVTGIGTDYRQARLQAILNIEFCSALSPKIFYPAVVEVINDIFPDRGGTAAAQAEDAAEKNDSIRTLDAAGLKKVAGYAVVEIPDQSAVFGGRGDETGQMEKGIDSFERPGKRSRVKEIAFEDLKVGSAFKA
jgi:hypothetical protein